MLSFSNVTLRRGPRALLEGVSFTAHAGWRLGVVGRNGTGKSSLFEMVLGGIAPDRGEISLPKNLEIASVEQETPALPQPAVEFVLDGDAELRATQAQLTVAEAEHDAKNIAALHERLNVIGGYAAPARAARLLHGLGFAADRQARPVAEFSGGWRMRLNLARALMCRSDLLLLDEPTNHLDLDTVIWLQDWLRGYTGTLLLISHDREFLDAVTDHTLHLHAGTATLYSGNYSQFERLRAEAAAQQAAAYAQQQRQLAHLQAFVDRFRAKATKARQAQSRLKQIERMERIAPAHVDDGFSFFFRAPPKVPSPLLRLDQVSVGYGGRPTLAGLKLGIEPGDRIGLLGPNGAGKSTLVRLLAGELPPISGEVLRAPDLRVGYFAQHQLEQLDLRASPLLHLRRLDPDAPEQALRDFLGGFDFRGDRVFEPAAPLSGGEKARLALALVVYQRPNLLLLDEPTNHLDLDMRYALELALTDFAGAVLLVSHDRHLVGTCCDELWRIADGRCMPFDGDLDDYAHWLLARQSDGASRDKAPGATSAKDQRRAAAQRRERLRPLRETVKKLDAQMARLRRRLDEIQAQLADPALYGSDARHGLDALLREQGKLRRQLEEAEERWLAVAAELEQLQAAG
ncbi:MAG: ATP-binding cassette domain-containing protein [Gammaproteobacteria bacterium]|nr:ATP-binding cassette domain-containing protein [Gammaproteobacteria bacterium]